MKIAPAKCGSRGDVQPMPALSLALQDAGYDVLLAGSPQKAQCAYEPGCPYRSMETDVMSFMDDMKDAFPLALSLFSNIFFKMRLFQGRSIQKRVWKMLSNLLNQEDRNYIIFKFMFWMARINRSSEEERQWLLHKKGNLMTP